ncbi:MAG: hypothetical protein ABIV36_11075 [Sphingobium limneticum]
MTDWPLTVALVLVFAAGICGGVAFASIIYARRYRALRLEIWGERMADEVDAQRQQMQIGEVAAAIRVELYRAVPSMPNYPVGIVEPVLEAALAEARP